MTFPEHWAGADLGVVADTKLGKMLSEKARDGPVQRPYLRNVNVRWGRIDTSDMLTMHFSQEEASKFRLDTGDLLVCEGGEPGRAAVWRNQLPGTLYQKALHRIRPRQGVNPVFLMYYLMWATQAGGLASLYTGSTIKHLPQEVLERLQVPLPPSREQHRIASALEQYFSDVDASTKELHSIQERISHYRSAVLRAACEGRLVPTEAELARAEKREFDSASAWLIRHGIELEESPTKTEMPEGWARVRLVKVAEPKLGLVDPRAFPSVLHLAPDNIESNTGRLLPCRTIAEDGMTSPKHKFFAGNIVYSKIRPHLSKVALPRFDGLCSADMYPLQVSADARYAHIAMLTEDFLRQAVAFQGRSVLPKINLDGLSQLWISLPPLPEQRRIVAEVERRLSVVEQLEAAIERSLQRAARLRQAILKQAFEGKLVPQDPSDEPASMLLERIRKERERVAGERTATGKRKGRAFAPSGRKT